MKPSGISIDGTTIDVEDTGLVDEVYSGGIASTDRGPLEELSPWEIAFEAADSGDDVSPGLGNYLALPELGDFDVAVRLESIHDAFVEALGEYLSGSEDKPQITVRDLNDFVAEAIERVVWGEEYDAMMEEDELPVIDATAKRLSPVQLSDVESAIVAALKGVEVLEVDDKISDLVRNAVANCLDDSADRLYPFG